MRSRTLLACADGPVGKTLVEWMNTQFPGVLSLVVTTSQNNIFRYCEARGIAVEELSGRTIEEIVYSSLGTKVDTGLLLWWPNILRVSDIDVSNQGFINTHPSLLPLHRGKNPNFWALKCGEPFGVSLHFLGSGIDDGDLIAQRQIFYDWTDNAETLYRRGQQEMVDLFKATFHSILSGNPGRIKQSLETGNFHYAREMEEASFLDLNSVQPVRDTLNLLRARTFSGHPSCWFVDDQGEEYEVRVTIQKRSPLDRSS